MFSYPRTLVVAVLEEDFGCRIHETSDPEFLAVSCDGPLRAAVLYVEEHEVLHDALRFLCDEIGLSYELLTIKLDVLVNPGNLATD